MLCEDTLALDVPSALARESADPVEDALVAAARMGDARAFQRLHRLHVRTVTRIVGRMLGARGQLGAIDDVTQDVFLQVFRSLPNFRGESLFKTWLHSIAVRVTLMHLRAQRCRPVLCGELPDQAGSDDDSPMEGCARGERLRALDRVLQKLSDKKRMVYVLHELEGLTPHEIAEMVDAPVFTVRTRLFYARREVYEAMARDPALGPALAESRG